MWLQRLGSPEWISVVPGNHDALVSVPPADGWDHWRPYTTSDPDIPDGESFPFLRRRGQVAVIGLSTACPSAPGWATGRLGADQVARVERLLGRRLQRKQRDEESEGGKRAEDNEGGHGDAIAFQTLPCIAAERRAADSARFGKERAITGEVGGVRKERGHFELRSRFEM